MKDDGTTKAQKLWAKYQELRDVVMHRQQLMAERQLRRAAIAEELERLVEMDGLDAKCIRTNTKVMFEITQSLPGLMHSEISGQCGSIATDDEASDG